MGIKPWLTSDDLIATVKRNIAIPISQRTFTETDILAFLNQELLISQVPDIMTFHEEYFVHSQDIPLVSNQRRYPVPERAIGQKLRDIFYVDDNGNLFEMVRVNPDDKAYWQWNNANTNSAYIYYLEGNDVVLAPFSPPNPTNPTGSLRVSYFLRPNQLVPNDEAAISSSFFKNIQIVNASLVAGDTLTIDDGTNEVVFTAVSSGATALQFNIGVSSAVTAANLATAINNAGVYTANSGSSDTVAVFYKQLSLKFTSTSIGIAVSTQIGIQFTTNTPKGIVDGVTVDFLRTKPGHQTLAMDAVLGVNSVSSNAILFDANVIPEDFIVGDYICLQYECIIPQIPPDLHNGLAERACARILSAQGDMQGFQLSAAKIGEIKRAEGVLTDNRVDGSPQKVTQRKGMLGWQRIGIYRRF